LDWNERDEETGIFTLPNINTADIANPIFNFAFYNDDEEYIHLGKINMYGTEN